MSSYSARLMRDGGKILNVIRTICVSCKAINMLNEKVRLLLGSYRSHELTRHTRNSSAHVHEMVCPRQDEPAPTSGSSGARRGVPAQHSRESLGAMERTI